MAGKGITIFEALDKYVYNPQPEQTSSGGGTSNYSNQDNSLAAQHQRDQAAAQQRAEQRAALKPQLNFPQYETMEQTVAGLADFDAKTKGLITDPLSEMIVSGDRQKYLDQIEFLGKIESGKLSSSLFGQGVDPDSLAGQMLKDNAVREQKAAQDEYTSRISEGLSTDAMREEKFAGKPVDNYVENQKQLQQNTEELTALNTANEYYTGYAGMSAEQLANERALNENLLAVAQSTYNTELYEAASAALAAIEAAEKGVSIDSEIAKVSEEQNAVADEINKIGSTNPVLDVVLGIAKTTGAAFEDAFYTLAGSYDHFGQENTDELRAQQHQKAAELYESGASDLERAKYGRGTGAQLAVDVGSGALGLAGDAALSAINPALGVASLATRSFGGGALEARAEGADEGEAFLAGVVQAGKEVTLNKLLGGLGKIYGKSSLAKATDEVWNEVAKNPVLAKTLRAVFNSEGVEEFLSAALDPAVGTIYNGKSIGEAYSEADIGEMLYQALIGQILGTAATGVEVLSEPSVGNRQGDDYVPPQWGLKPDAQTQTQADLEVPKTGSKTKAPEIQPQTATEGAGDVVIPPTTQTADTAQSDVLNKQVNDSERNVLAEVALAGQKTAPAQPVTQYSNNANADGDFRSSVAPSFKPYYDYLKKEIEGMVEVANTKQNLPGRTFFGNAEFSDTTFLSRSKGLINRIIRGINNNGTFYYGSDAEPNKAHNAYKLIAEQIGYTITPPVVDAHTHIVTSKIVPINGKAVTDTAQVRQVLEDILYKGNSQTITENIVAPSAETNNPLVDVVLQGTASNDKIDLQSEKAGAVPTGKRSNELQSIINRLANNDDKITLEDIRSIPEIADAYNANSGEPTINLPGREEKQLSAADDAMQKGSWDANSKTYSGEVKQGRRMDIVIGLPGSGKSSVYTERLSEEHKSRVIDTDDFRDYIDEYNGKNAQVVHEEASKIKDIVFRRSLNRGDNILLSTIGADPEKMAEKIKIYVDGGYEVYLHLNELPNKKAISRALGRYVSEDGTTGRFVDPELIYNYGDKPTETYLYLTGQGGKNEGKLDGDIRESGRQYVGNAEKLVGREKGAKVELAGYDWYSNDVPKGQKPRLIQSSEGKVTSGNTKAKQESTEDLAGKNVREMEAPTAEDIKATVSKQNYGTQATRAQAALESMSKEIAPSDAEADAEKGSSAYSNLVDKVRATVEGDSEVKDFRQYYGLLKDSPKRETRSLYYKEVAEKLDEAAANLYGENGNKARGNKLAADAMSLLAKRVEQRSAADKVIAEINGRIDELTKKFKQTRFYRKKMADGKKFKLTAELLTPRNYLKMIDGFDKEAGGEGYKLADKEAKANETEKKLIVEAKRFFNDFLKVKDAEKFLNGYQKSGVKIGDHNLSMMELTHLVREWESALSTRQGGIDGISFKIKGKPVSFENDTEIVIPNERGTKITGTLGDEGNIERLRNTLDFLIEKNEAVAEYNKALDNMFEYFLPKLKEAHMNSEGFEMEDVLKYFPVSYLPKGGAVDAEADSFFTIFRNVKDRTRQDGGILMIDSTEGVIDRYIHNAAQYAAWADFSRQMQMLSEKGASGISMLDVVGENLGEDVAGQLKQYAEALRFERSTAKKNLVEKGAGFLRKNLGQAALTLKLTTPMKQAAGTMAAAGDIKLRYLLASQVGGGRKYKGLADDNELLQHRGLGDIDATMDNVAKLNDTAWKRAISKLPGGKTWLSSISRADQRAVRNIYYAAAMQVSAENGNADISKSDALMEQVDKLFADALLNTQSDATKISASNIYRSENELVKNVVLFKSQQNAQLNATITAALEAAAAKGSKAETEANKKYARVVGGQIVSSVEFAILGGVADALLHKGGKYEDEDDEITIESVLSELGDNAAETLFGIKLFGDTMYNLAASGMQMLAGKDADTIYNPSMGGINTIIDLTTKINNFFRSPTPKNVKNFAVTMSNALGVPLAGAYDMVNAMALWTRDVVKSIESGSLNISGERDIIDVIVADMDKTRAVTGKSAFDRFTDMLTGNAPTEKRKASYDAIDALMGETGKTSLTPADFEGKVSANSKEYILDEDEKAKYAETAMDSYYSIIDQLVDNVVFKDAGVELKEAIVREAKKYANDLAKVEYLEGEDLEYTSEYASIKDGIVKRGKDDDGNPVPDIPAIPERDIPEYLAYKTAFSDAEKKKDYNGIDALLEGYKKLPKASREQFKANDHSSIIEAYDAGVSSKSYYKYKESLDRQSEKLDLNTTDSVTKLYGIANAKIPSAEKNILADIVLGANTKAVYQAASKHDYSVSNIPELYERINADKDSYIEQAELYSVYTETPAIEIILQEIWKAKGWKTSWEQYKAKQR